MAIALSIEGARHHKVPGLVSARCQSIGRASRGHRLVTLELVWDGGKRGPIVVRIPSGLTRFSLMLSPGGIYECSVGLHSTDNDYWAR